MYRLRLNLSLLLALFLCVACSSNSTTDHAPDQSSSPEQGDVTEAFDSIDANEDIISEQNPPTDSAASEGVDTAAVPETHGSWNVPEIAVGELPLKLEGFKAFFSKYVDVFGVHIVATSDTPDVKVLHAARVMAHYLDNDKDGVPDNPAVVEAMVNAGDGSILVMFNHFEDLENSDLFDTPLIYDYAGQDLMGVETHPEGSSDPWGFDATLEEVLHLITSVGYANAYPAIFGEDVGTTIGKAMDKARGGRHMSVPAQYPDGAWYHYDDTTCDYRCQVTEYFYWALTSMLGAQEYGNRCAEISIEWELCSRDLVEDRDPDIFELLTTTHYALPTVIPDGNYP